MAVAAPAPKTNAAGTDARQGDGSPWWRHSFVWLLLVAGPATVVVAGFVTLWLAIRTPDPVIEEDYYQKGLNINETLKQQKNERSMLPAVKGRNHAATPEEVELK